MKGFLFDEKLPSKTQFSPSQCVVSVTSIGPNSTDTQIRDFAKKRELAIVSKDADFSARAWPKVETLLKTHSL